ncbi:MAG: hypothetical protein FJ298_03290 [Planctomycetes bacterium]|nr:hypothetical protein [Planctomycetota bacterium]
MATTLHLALAALLLAPATQAQHVQTSPVAVHPSAPSQVWVCNRDNDSVSVINAPGGVATHEIQVGVRPRALGFSHDGARVFVANQRGNIPLDANSVTGFGSASIRGSVSVIDTATKHVVTTLTQVGTEPCGLAVAPNGRYFAVTALRSGTVKLFRTSSLTLATEHEYLWDLSHLPPSKTIADADRDRDGMADLGEPRAVTIHADSTRLYVTHNRSPWVSVLDVTLDTNGEPSGIALADQISIDDYPFDPFFNPVPQQTLRSQGQPRFLDDIALSPDGSRALVPHLLHNINHDVNFTYPPWFPGDFANRVYPALTVIDAAAGSFGVALDQSRRLHNELSHLVFPAEFGTFGQGADTSVGRATIGGMGEPVTGGTLRLVVQGMAPGQTALAYIGTETSVSHGALGTRLVNPRRVFPVPPSGVVLIPIPAVARLNGTVSAAQALFFTNGQPTQFSNGLRVRVERSGTGQNRLGHRAGHPSKVAFNASGDRALMLNRGSEDLFLYDVNGSNLRLANVFPPRVHFVERAALDTATPLGDLPLGMAIVPDASTSNDDALVYVMNELTRTLSVLRVDWAARSITQEHAQIPTLLGPDALTPSQVLGDELFEDASRAQTTGAPGEIGGWNNSCASCHFEGGEDGNVWQRPQGPRSTMPTYGGSLGTGLLLWKGVRLNLGETGPMFGGENGGHGILSDVEQQALVDAHNVMPVPLNPHLDPVTGQRTPLAELGRDLFFGENNTGLNPSSRHAGCFNCHPLADPSTGALRGYTADFLNPLLTDGENLGALDPSCFSLQANIVALNVRDINSGVNVDTNNDGLPDTDRNVDGYADVETYTPMNRDRNDPFQRDDINSYLCPTNPNNPSSSLKTFQRDQRAFSIPTKLGVFSTGPYFHDHVAYSLRTILDPEAQALSPVYGSPAFPGAAFPGMNKFFNEFHDVRGHEQFVAGASKVQVNLASTNVDADIAALLAFIESL